MLDTAMRTTGGRGIALFSLLALGFGGYMSQAPVTAAAAQSASVDYNLDIRPILAQSCFSCHGSNERARQADLRLDTREFLETQVVPADAEASDSHRVIRLVECHWHDELRASAPKRLSCGSNTAMVYKHGCVWKYLAKRDIVGMVDSSRQ